MTVHHDPLLLFDLSLELLFDEFLDAFDRETRKSQAATMRHRWGSNFYSSAASNGDNDIYYNTKDHYPVDQFTPCQRRLDVFERLNHAGSDIAAV